MLANINHIDKLNSLVTFSVPMSRIDELAELEGKDIELTAEKKRNKRSRNANSYMWELCEQIARKIKSTKEDVYRRAVREVGLFRDVELQSDAVNTIRTVWAMNGTGWFTESISQNDKTETVRLYYGSSCYNTLQMARLIQYIADDAEELGIQTDLTEIKQYR